MSNPPPTIVLAGDKDDPCVAALKAALPRDAVVDLYPGELPEEWPSTVRTVVIHRAILTNAEADRLRRLRGRVEASPRVVLCIGPHVRYHMIERWSMLADVVLPEATAAEVVARHLADAPPRRPPAAPAPLVSVLSGNHELRQMLCDTVQAAGYNVAATTGDEPAGRGLIAWDAPVLEEDWPDRLARLAQAGPTVALIGFADRETVVLARSRGASACLDLPCDPADITFVLDRLTARLGSGEDGAHVLPPPPAWRRQASRARGSAVDLDSRPIICEDRPERP